MAEPLGPREDGPRLQAARGQRGPWMWTQPTAGEHRGWGSRCPQAGMRGNVGVGAPGEHLEGPTGWARGEGALARWS